VFSRKRQHRRKRSAGKLFALPSRWRRLSMHFTPCIRQGADEGGQIIPRRSGVISSPALCPRWHAGIILPGQVGTSEWDGRNGCVAHDVERLAPSRTQKSRATRSLRLRRGIFALFIRAAGVASA